MKDANGREMNNSKRRRQGRARSPANVTATYPGRVETCGKRNQWLRGADMGPGRLPTVSFTSHIGHNYL